MGYVNIEQFIEMLCEMCPEFEEEQDVINNFEGYFVTYNKFLERISHAWNGVPCYNNDPLELIATLINERDEAIQENKKLKEQVGNPWISVEDKTTPKDGTRVVACEDGGKPYITAWTDDVYKFQGGSGGVSGWFSGRYSDEWGDKPIMDHPDYWMPLPNKPTER